MIIISHQSEQSIINFIIMQCHVIRNKLRKLKLKLNVEVLKAYEIQGMCVCVCMYCVFQVLGIGNVYTNFTYKVLYFYILI